MIAFRWLEIPTARRSWHLAWLALLVASAFSRGVRAETLVEADVVRRATERSTRVALARAEAELFEAREREARLYPNPSLAWSREHLLEDEAGREDVLSLSVPIDLSGRRSAQAALARAGTRAAHAETARTRSVVVLHALETFYRAIAAEARTAVAQRSRERLAESVRVQSRRQEEGNVAGYERVRLELELELAENDFSQAKGEAEALRLELGVLLGAAAPLELRGELRVADPGAPDKTSGSPPSLELARAATFEAEAATRSAESAWVPLIELSGGFKAESTDRTRYGYVAGVTLDLPIFSRGQELRALSHAEERLARARADANLERLQLEKERASRNFRRAGAELARFEQATRARLSRLERAIEAGYREGTRSLGDLLDAEDARAAIELRRIELALSMRRAELALRGVRGDFER